MKETSAGVYEGTFTVPKNASVSRAAVLGKLVAGGVTSALIQAPGTITIAGQPPKITDFGPARDATVESEHPLIYATLSECRRRHQPGRDADHRGRQGCHWRCGGDAVACSLTSPRKR